MLPNSNYEGNMEFPKHIEDNFLNLVEKNSLVKKQVDQNTSQIENKDESLNSSIINLLKCQQIQNKRDSIFQKENDEKEKKKEKEKMKENIRIDLNKSNFNLKSVNKEKKSNTLHLNSIIGSKNSIFEISPHSKKNDIDIFEVHNENIQNKKYYKYFSKILENKCFNVAINFLIVYALFADDIKVISFNKKVDDYFDSITIFCMICFLFEISLSIYCTPNYLNSFFFWLDLLSTFSLILDLAWVNKNFVSNRLFIFLINKIYK